MFFGRDNVAVELILGFASLNGVELLDNGSNLGWCWIINPGFPVDS